LFRRRALGSDPLEEDRGGFVLRVLRHQLPLEGLFQDALPERFRLGQALVYGLFQLVAMMSPIVNTTLAD